MGPQCRKYRSIAKRPVANAPWRFQERPSGHYAEVYWDRWKAMSINPQQHDWQELALRFTAFLPGVHSCIVGTRSIEHLRHNAAIVEQGPLPEDLVSAIRLAFQHNDQNWTQET